MIDLDRLTDDRINSTRAAGFTQYGNEEIRDAATAYNKAEVEYDEVLNSAYDALRPFIFEKSVIPMLSDSDAPEAVKALFSRFYSEWESDYQNGRMTYGAHEAYTVGTWRKATSKYNAEIKRLRKAEKAVRDILDAEYDRLADDRNEAAAAYAGSYKNISH